MAFMEKKEGVWQLPKIEITSNGTVERTLQTKNTYIDGDIHVQIDTPDATYDSEAGELTVDSSITSDYISSTETPYAFTVTSSAHAAESTVSVKDAGFAAADDSITIDAQDESGDKTFYVKAGSLTSGEATVGASSDTVELSAATESSTGFIIAVEAEGSVGVGTAGWVEPGTASDVADKKYYSVQAASLSNNETGNFTEVTAPILTEDGYLYINEGYIENTKISLATLVPDDANITSENAEFVYNTVTAYDKDGKLIVGTMKDAKLGSITADDATATIGTVELAPNAEKSAFVVSGSQAIAGTASVGVSQVGYAKSDLSASGEISGTATVNATVGVVSLAADKTEDGAVTPEIKKEVSTAASGSIVTVAPTDAHYVAVSADAIAQTVTVSPKVSTAGYGTADVFTASDITVTGGSKATGTYYVPIDNGSVVSTMGEVSVVNPEITVTTSKECTDSTVDLSGILTAAPTEGQYITLNASTGEVEGTISGTVTTAVTEGYVTAAASNSKTVEGTITVAAAEKAQYIKVYDGAYVL